MYPARGHGLGSAGFVAEFGGAVREFVGLWVASWIRGFVSLWLGSWVRGLVRALSGSCGELFTSDDTGATDDTGAGNRPTNVRRNHSENFSQGQRWGVA